MKIYRDIYLKNYSKFPYCRLTGRWPLLYSGRIMYNVQVLPESFNENKDLYITCDCDFSKWKKVEKNV